MGGEGMTTRVLAAAHRGARSVGTALLDCFLPRFCAVCRARFSSGGHLCAECSGRLQPAPFAYCPMCRFEDEGVRSAEWAPGALCPVHAGVGGLAGLHVQEPVLELIHRLKYSGERWLARTLADLMPDPREYRERYQRYDLMCPVPLHRTRLRERGFNQSGELATRLEPRLGVPFMADLLVKTAPTPVQARLGGQARRRNLRGCFAVARPSVVRNRNVILVDDLVTTGSTASACLDALKSAGAVRVVVLTVAA